MLPQLDEILSGKNRKIVFAGIGNVLKSDDGIGVYISSRIRKRKNLEALTVEVSIENYIGKINSLNPDVLILIDCVDMNSPPGTSRLMRIDEIRDFTFNTHNISLRRITEFFNAEVFILGIQPLNVDFGEKISYLVAKEANRIIEQINKEEVSHGS
ncbi:MAG: hydrogenase maturation protease [Bacteroidales bacterium]|nr:hydrogenase maturation protease [Bacteroidales bacterium]